jgi:hypothetical protein
MRTSLHINKHLQAIKSEAGFTTVEVLIALFIGTAALIPLAITAVQCLETAQRDMKAVSLNIEAYNAATETYQGLITF